MRSEITVLILALIVISSCSESTRNNDYYEPRWYYSLDEALSDPDEVEYLTLSNIGDSLTERIGELTNLWALSIIDSPIEYLPSQIASLPKLRHVSFYNCAFSHIPPQVMTQRIVDFIFINCDIDTVPIEIRSMTSLRSVQLTGNNVTEMPRETMRLDWITGLSLDSNRLIRFDYHANDFPRLKELCLAGNLLPDSTKARIRAEFSPLMKLTL